MFIGYEWIGFQEVNHRTHFASAVDYLKQFSPVKGLPGEVVNAQNLGLQGDIAVENGDLETAVKLFAKAVKASLRTKNMKKITEFAQIIKSLTKNW